MDLQSNPVNEILYVSFNQDFTCFVCGTENGFRVYSTDPFKLTHRRDFENNGGLGVVAMLFRTNILAFAGGGQSPRFPPHKVVLWDDRQAKPIAELSFRAAVKSVRLRRDLVVVVTCSCPSSGDVNLQTSGNSKVYVYAFRSLLLSDSIETISNPKGLCCLSVGTDKVVLVCPGMQQGRALVVVYPQSFGDSQAPVAREKTLIIRAHESPIAAMAMDYNGSLLATASEKGTIIRVFDTATGNRVQELRRGADKAEIHSLTFSPTGEYLAASSDKGTVHIFAIRAPGAPAVADGERGRCNNSNNKSSLTWISKVLPAYFSSEWSLAQFRVPDYRCIAAFGAESNTIIVVCANGSYYKARFDPQRGGEMHREVFEQFDQASVEAARSLPAEPPGTSMVVPQANAINSSPAGVVEADRTALGSTQNSTAERSEEVAVSAVPPATRTAEDALLRASGTVGT